ncbi:putative PepSY-like beta-lactamase-inhibitor [Chitinophaga skermanii]|uniref:Putative PepSY-like beta-lactamase-inhibitor n=1 Tax=Chitinophaga skermanii TaxID=331697 RepID=A0A327R0K0_9BACT|nr:PepSY-like domain-containing protein [Chitinophaga skermanii]RAJ10416.1 putative PepSY-like beta-lactamase-inhibitor [Chitinophaga skermanii]
MKKLIAILSVAALLFSATSFAADKYGKAIISNQKVLNSFNQEFAGAAKVTWYANEDEKSYVAKFDIKESRVTAHFDDEGNLLATSRVISDSDLPLPVISRLMHRYPNENIRNVVEYTANGSLTYMITLENDTQWKIIKAGADGGLSTVRKLRKA